MGCNEERGGFKTERDVHVLQNEERERIREQLADTLTRLTAEQQKSAALQGLQSQLQTERRRNAELAAELAKDPQVASRAEQSQQADASDDVTSVGTDVVHQLACLQGSATALGRCSLPQLHRCRACFNPMRVPFREWPWQQCHA